MPKQSSEKQFNSHIHKSCVVDFCFHKELKHLILAENFPANLPIMHSHRDTQSCSNRACGYWEMQRVVCLHVFCTHKHVSVCMCVRVSPAIIGRMGHPALRCCQQTITFICFGFFFSIWWSKWYFHSADKGDPGETLVCVHVWEKEREEETVTYVFVCMYSFIFMLLSGLVLLSMSHAKEIPVLLSPAPQHSIWK